MKFSLISLGLSLLSATPIFAESFSYTVTATKNGKPVDASNIKLVPFDSSRSGGVGGVATAKYTPAPNPGPPGARTSSSSRTKPKPPKLKSRSRRTSKRASGSLDAGGQPISRRDIGIAWSGNWCGAAYTTPTTNVISSVHGVFQVPTPTIRPNVSLPQWMAEWVGIDGANNGVVLQAGAGQSINAAGWIANWVWWEWYPLSSVAISSMNVTSGDWIEVTVTATSSVNGVITINNLSQSETYTIYLNNGPALPRVSAEWIVEDQLNAFPTFNDIWFEETYAVTANSSQYGIDASQILYLKDGNSYCYAQEWDNADFVAWSA